MTRHPFPRTRSLGSLLLGTLLTSTACTTVLSGESDDEWTGAARVIANELTRDLITGQTVEPDPARRGDPRRVESGTSRLRGDAPWSLPIID